MILPPVSELLGRVARHAALEASFDALRRKGGEVRRSRWRRHWHLRNSGGQS
jgi:hypothetical protein